MNKQQFEFVAPPLNDIVYRSGVAWLCSYHNPGQRRYSREAVAIIIPDPDNKDQKLVRLLSSGEDYTMEAWEEYRRRVWPMRHEVGRNPNNATLGVHSGTGVTKGGM